MNDGTTNALLSRLWTTAAVVRERTVDAQSIYFCGEIYPLKRLEEKRRIRCYAEDVYYTFVLVSL